MSAITEILGDDLIKDSREDINNNFDALNDEKIETSVLDTDTTLSANSDAKIATQKAVKAYVDSGGNQNASETTRGIVEEATDAEVTAGTATGATGAKLFVTPAKLKTYPIVETTAGTTHSLTTIAGQKVIVWAKGAILDGGYDGGNYAINLKYGGTLKDVTYQQLGNTSNKYGFALMYTETPGAATANITVDFTAPGGGGTLSDVKIIVQKF